MNAARRSGTRSPPDPAQGVARRLPDRVHRDGRTWSERSRARMWSTTGNASAPPTGRRVVFATPVRVTACSIGDEIIETPMAWPAPHRHAARARKMRVRANPVRPAALHAVGGSFHCATLDIQWRGTLESYFRRRLHRLPAECSVRPRPTAQEGAAPAARGFTTRRSHRFGRRSVRSRRRALRWRGRRSRPSPR